MPDVAQNEPQVSDKAELTTKILECTLTSGIPLRFAPSAPAVVGTMEPKNQDEKLLRQRLPIRLPRNTPITMKYNRRIDVLTVFLGTRDKWPPRTRVEGDATIHLEENGDMARLEFAHASKVFPIDWLKRHCRESGPRKRLGLP